MTAEERAAANAVRGIRAEQLKRRTRLIADTRGEILRLLKLALERIAARLALQPSDAERWLLTELQAEVRRTMAEFAEQAAAKVSTAAGRAWEAGQELVDAPLAAAGIRLDGLVPALDTRQLIAMRAFMTDRIKDVGLQAANKINTELGLVVLGAQPPTAAVTAVTAILGETSRARAITIVRTELSRVYAVASHERLMQAGGGEQPIVPGLKKQWRRSGKVHSRLMHDLADGQVQDVDTPFKLGNGARLMFPHDPKAPPAETINCGCIALPWKADWEVATPGRKRYTALEMQANPMKRDVQDAIDSGRSVNDLIAGGKAA